MFCSAFLLQVLSFSALGSPLTGPSPLSAEVHGKAEGCTCAWRRRTLSWVLMGQSEILVLGEPSLKVLLILEPFWDPWVLLSPADFHVRVRGP